MFLFPGPILLQLPSVNDVAVENKFLTGVISQKLSSFFGLRSGRAQMDILQNNRAKLGT